MKCRILYVVGQLGAGGLERQLYLLLQTMDRDRYRPEVVVWNFRETDIHVPRIRELGVPLHSFPTKMPAAGKMAAFVRIALKIRPEVIHSYSFYTNIAAWWAALRTKSIAVGAVRSNFTNDKTSCGFLLGSLNARWPSTQIYNNLAGANKARKSSKLLAPRRIVVVRNGVDLAKFERAPLSTNGQVRIVGVGSLLKVKRWDRLLMATSKLKKSKLDFLLEIAGAGPLRESLEKQAQRLGITDRVRFTGHTDDVARLLGSSTFLAHSSDIEGCPNVIMEAMASGRAVVATDVGDTRCLVEDGITGFVVKAGDDATLAERLATLVNNRDLCRQMGEAARAKAEREFGLSRFAEGTLGAYRTAGWKDF
jgi:glycosyltransferase involved in cell wall biosynthesis